MYATTIIHRDFMDYEIIIQNLQTRVTKHLHATTLDVALEVIRMSHLHISYTIDDIERYLASSSSSNKEPVTAE